MKYLIVVFLIVACAVISGSGCKSRTGDREICPGECLTAQECSERATVPVNPSKTEYDCPEGTVCCILIDGGLDAAADSGQDAASR